MKKETLYVTDREGNAVAGAEVYVRTGGGSLATIYSDNGVTTAANPLTSDNDGEVNWYVADGSYTIQIYVEGVQQQEVTGVQIYDGEDNEIKALRSVTSASDKGFYFTGSGTGSTYDLTSFGRSLGGVEDAEDARTLLGITEEGGGAQPADSTLTALSLFNSNGILVQTAADTFVARTITGTANEITVGNGDGVAGNPTLSLPTPLKTHTVTLLVSDPNGSAITTGDGKAYWPVPSQLNGCDLISAKAFLTTVSSSGIPTVQIANVTQAADMLSTKLTIDASEATSATAATPVVIDTGNDDVATGDMLRIDVDVSGTGAKGLIVEMQFRLP